MSAELKYSEYSKREEFRDDVKILVIVWDDFINEVISALVNPSAGLLTENSFTKNINYGNIDSIMVTRFLTPLKRLFYFGEAGTTRSQDIQNVFLSPTTTSGLSFKLSDRFDPNIFVDFVYPYSLDLVVAENYPTDFIDWGLSVGITGISKCPVNIRTRLLKYIMKITGTKELYSYNYINFILVNINKIWNEELNHTDNLNKIRKCINLAVHASTLPIEKLEIDIEAYIKGSLRYQQKVEGDYQKKKGTSEICSCKSDYLFKDCCEKKLQHYKYTSFYNR